MGTALIPEPRIDATGRVPEGLELHPGFVSEGDQREILDWIRDNATWPFRFDGTPAETLAGPNVPEWARRLGAAIVDAGLLPVEPDYVHLVEYTPGMGLPSHVDHPTTGEIVVGVNLGSTRVLEMARLAGDDRLRLLLHPGDVYVMRGEARDDWDHGVPAVAVDTFGGRDYERELAVSVTLRRCVPPAPEATPPG